MDTRIRESDDTRQIGFDTISLPMPVRIARKAGEGATLPVRLGGKLGPASGEPLDLNVEVLAVRERYMHVLPQARGDPWLFPAGDVAALRSQGIDVIVGSERCQCYAPSVFVDLGIDPMKKKLLIAKSYQHFQRAFSELGGEIIYIASPGAVPPDPRLLRYTRLDTSRLYPWVQDPFAAGA